MKRYRVVHWASAVDLGFREPWICSEDEAIFDADSHDVTDGVLTLFRNGEPSAVFAPGRWVVLTIEEPAPIA